MMGVSHSKWNLQQLFVLLKKDEELQLLSHEQRLISFVLKHGKETLLKGPIGAA